VQPRPASPDRALTGVPLNTESRGPFCAKKQGPDSVVIDNQSGRKKFSAGHIHEFHCPILCNQVGKVLVDEKDERRGLSLVHRCPFRPIIAHRMPCRSLVLSLQKRLRYSNGLNERDLATHRLEQSDHFVFEVIHAREGKPQLRGVLIALHLQCSIEKIGPWRRPPLSKNTFGALGTNTPFPQGVFSKVIQYGQKSLLQPLYLRIRKAPWICSQIGFDACMRSTCSAGDTTPVTRFMSCSHQQMYKFVTDVPGVDGQRVGNKTSGVCKMASPQRHR
jgi:hypothetical protein